MSRDLKRQDIVTTIETNLQPLIEQVMDSFGLAGLAIGIVKDAARRFQIVGRNPYIAMK